MSPSVGSSPVIPTTELGLVYHPPEQPFPEAFMPLEFDVQLRTALPAPNVGSVIVTHLMLNHGSVHTCLDLIRTRRIPSCQEAFEWILWSA
jgi:hypothetical protein